MNSDWPYYSTTWSGATGAETHHNWVDSSAAMDTSLNMNIGQTQHDASLLETILRLAFNPNIQLNVDDDIHEQPQNQAQHHDENAQPSNIDLLIEYSGIMRAYNANIQGYISSMNAYNENMRQLMLDARTRRRAETPSIYDFTYVFQPNLRRTPNVGRVNNRAPILSQDQIAMSTRLIRYSPDINESRCPISLDNFTEGEEITQIIHCGHVFRTNNLMSWFRRSSRCPVCRHNIMTYTPPNSTVEDTAYTYEE